MSSNNNNSKFQLVGVIHLPPLPGAVNFRDLEVRNIASIAANDAQVLMDSGFTHVMIQDGNDMPQPTRASVATIASLSAIGAKVRDAIKIPLGVIVGHNDGAASVAIGKAIDADFIRVKVLTGVSYGPNGWMEGCSAEVGLMKRLLESDIAIWADANEVTSRSLNEDKTWSAQQAINFGGAQKIIITHEDGPESALKEIKTAQSNVGKSTDFLIGGRVSLTTIGAVMKAAQGAIIGSAINNELGSDAFINSTNAQAFGRSLI